MYCALDPSAGGLDHSAPSWMWAALPTAAGWMTSAMSLASHWGSRKYTCFKLWSSKWRRVPDERVHVRTYENFTYNKYTM